jgi:hypothetical protein
MTFEEFIEKVMTIACEFAKSRDAIIKYSKPNEEESVFELGKSPLDESLLYHFITNSEKKQVYYLRFDREDNSHYRLYIDSGRLQLQQVLKDNLDRWSGYPYDEINKHLDQFKGNFSEKLIFYLTVMWNGENWIRYAYLGITFNLNEAYFENSKN